MPETSAALGLKSTGAFFGRSSKLASWALAHAALTLIFCAIVWAEFDREAVLFFLLGSGISFANLGALYFIWKRAVAKKSIALASSVIVLKYGISGYLLYKVAKLGVYPLGWTAGGLGLFLLSALSMATLSMRAVNLRPENVRPED